MGFFLVLALRFLYNPPGKATRMNLRQGDAKFELGRLDVPKTNVGRRNRLIQPDNDRRKGLFCEVIQVDFDRSVALL